MGDFSLIRTVPDTIPVWMYRTMDEVEKECYEEGREKGRETQAELTAINLRKLGLPLEQIAHAVGFHVEKVEKWVK